MTDQAAELSPERLAELRATIVRWPLKFVTCNGEDDACCADIEDRDGDSALASDNGATKRDLVDAYTALPSLLARIEELAGESYLNEQAAREETS